MPKGIRSRYVVAGGIRTHYSESGEDGRVLVALHGGGHGSSGAAGMGPLMALLGDEFRVLALDSIGGFGDTDVNARSPYGLQSRVDHLAAVLDALCIDRCVLAGNSQGAWCVAKYAITHPDRVESLVLLGSATIANAMGLNAPESDGMRLMRGYDGTLEGMRGLLNGLVYNSDKVTDELIRMRHAAASRPGAREAFSDAAKANRLLQSDPTMSLNFDMRHTLPLLTKTIPTVMVWGKEDIFATPDLGRRLEPLLPDVRFHWIEGAGHQVQTDQPEAVASIVRSFCNLTPKA